MHFLPDRNATDHQYREQEVHVFREIINAYADNHMNPVHKLCTEYRIFNINTGDTYGNQHALKV
jgi:hypothetical protein